MKGRPEWDRQAANLKRLAEAYGTTFPLPAGGTARRMNDKETAAVADTLCRAANRFKSDLDKERPLRSPTRTPPRRTSSADQARPTREVPYERRQPGDHRSAPARRPDCQIQTFVGAHTISHGSTNWKAVQESLGKLQQAFGLTQ